MKARRVYDGTSYFLRVLVRPFSNTLFKTTSGDLYNRPQRMLLQPLRRKGIACCGRPAAAGIATYKPDAMQTSLGEERRLGVLLDAENQSDRETKSKLCHLLHDFIKTVNLKAAVELRPARPLLIYAWRQHKRVTARHPSFSADFTNARQSISPRQRLPR